MTRKCCGIEKCGKPHLARGMCGMHYRRWRLYGDCTVRHSIYDPDVRVRLDYYSEQRGTCREWVGARFESGYGLIRLAGRTRRAHRVSYEAAYGPIPDGLVVRHTCDNPPCINPEHLLLGTAKDNMADAVSRDRVARGERNAAHKVTEAQTREIRARAQAGATQQSIADDYGIHQTQVSRIVLGKSWKQVVEYGGGVSGFLREGEG